MADEKGKVFTDFMEWQKEKRKNIKIMFEIIEYLKSHEIYWEMDHMEGIPRITMVFKNCDNCPNFITEGCIWFYEDSMEVRVYYSELGADICKTSQNRSELYRLLNFLNARLWPRVSDGMGGTLYQSQHLLSPRFYVTEDDRYDITAAMMVSYTHFEMYALEIEDFITAALPGLMNVLSPFVFLVLVSLATAWVYSRIITNPVLKISRISKEMSDMRLEWQLEERRSDELGVLENSLNTLSRKLSATLEELQSANLQLQKDIEHQKALERAQQDFFSSASHELKTPITIIKGQLEGMLLGIGAYKDHEKYLARSLEIAATLETMVQEILTISRLETNVDFKMEHFDCAPMIHGYLREIDDLVATKELQIHLAIQSPAFINGNKLLIEKVFSNLISNAVKYSPHGASVDIILQNTNGRFLFSVENTGTHIPEDDIPKLFDAFYRMEQSRSRRTGGSGLGLYMVQRILQQHNSYCEACNTENGVKFFFTI